MRRPTCTWHSQTLDSVFHRVAIACHIHHQLRWVDIALKVLGGFFHQISVLGGGRAFGSKDIARAKSGRYGREHCGMFGACSYIFLAWCEK